MGATYNVDTKTDFKMRLSDCWRREDGIAMLTVLMLTIILTIIGIAAITTTTLDIRMAGGERLRETMVSAAESCLSSGVQIIQSVLGNGQIPATMTPGTNPQIPLPISVPPGTNPLEAEIFGYPGYVGYADTADPTAGGAPNAILTVGNSTVNIDIDRLYIRPKPGSAQGFAMAYEGPGAGAGAGGTEIMYRITCFANGPTQGFSQVTGVYACVSSGESCQRKI
jgi:Tfp pilus assembly protein PilX